MSAALGLANAPSPALAQGSAIDTGGGEKGVALPFSPVFTEDDGDPADIEAAVSAIDGFYADALDPETGEFLITLVGVVDDPFAI